MNCIDQTCLLSVLTTGLVVLFTSTAGAQSRVKDEALNKPLVTDRPDFTESTDAIPQGYSQLEAGYTFTYDREGSDRTREHTAPELLLRIGIAENFELRIGWDGYSWTDSQFEGETRGGRRITREDTSNGAQDMSLGFKHKLVEQDGKIPHFGVIGAITVPSGSAGISSGDVDPEVVFLWAYDVNDRFAIAGNVGVALPTDVHGRFVQTFASLSTAFTLTDELGTYLEYFGFVTLQPRAMSQAGSGGSWPVVR